MGAKQFSDTLRVLHIERYDLLHLQYLDWLVERYHINNWMGKKFAAFLPYEDHSPDGYAGFSPSAVWLRDVYDGFMEEHRSEIHQHTAMLIGDICAIDHSHKVMHTLVSRIVNLTASIDHKTCPQIEWGSDFLWPSYCHQ